MAHERNQSPDVNRGSSGLLTPLIGMLAILTSLGIAGAETSAAAGCDNLYVTCTVESGGARVGLSREELANYQQGRDAKTGAADKRTFEYTSVYACPTNVPGDPTADVPCTGAIQGCAGNTPDHRTLSLFRRVPRAALDCARAHDVRGLVARDVGRAGIHARVLEGPLVGRARLDVQTAFGSIKSGACNTALDAFLRHLATIIGGRRAG